MFSYPDPTLRPFPTSPLQLHLARFLSASRYFVATRVSMNLSRLLNLYNLTMR